MKKTRMNLIKAAPIPMAVATERDRYNATTWNDSWYREFGYSREEAEGRSGTEIGLWVNSREWKNFVDSVTAQNRISEFKILMRRRDGAVRICEVHGQLTGEVGKRTLMVAYLDITERKMAVDELIESEERFSKAFKSLPTPMSISDIKTGRLIDVNDKWLEMLGLSRESIIDKTSFEIGVWNDPGVRIRMGEELQKQGYLKEVPIELFSQSKGTRYVLWSAEIISLAGYEVMLSLFFDFTERKIAEDSLSESEAYNKVLFYDSLIPLVLLDPETIQFIDGNNAALKILDFTERNLFLGKTLLDVSTPCQYSGQLSEISLRGNIQQTLTQGFHTFEWNCQRSNGTTWDAEVHMKCLTLKKRGDSAQSPGHYQPETGRKVFEKQQGKIFQSISIISCPYGHK